MKSYFILDCEKQQKIADSLFGYYTGITANRKVTEFWNHLSREEIQDYFAIPNNPTKAWFDELGLKVRDMSFTIYNDPPYSRSSIVLENCWLPRTDDLLITY